MVARLSAADEGGAVGGWLDRIGVVRDVPETMAVSQLWQTPVRHDQRTGTSHASASSSRLGYSGLQATARLLRLNSIVGPLPGVPGGQVGRPAMARRRCRGSGRAPGRRARAWMRRRVETELGERGTGFAHERLRGRKGMHRRRAAARARRGRLRRGGRCCRSLGLRRRPDPGRLKAICPLPLASEARRVRDSSANGWSAPFRAP